MRRVSTVFLCTSLLLAAACSDDDGGPAGNGDGLEGVVRNFLYENAPVPGIAVGTPGGASDASDADGRFSLPGVTAPYDLVAVVPVVAGDGVILNAVVGGQGANPALGAVPAGWNNPNVAKHLLGGQEAPRAGYTQDGATVEGTVSNADAAGEEISVSIGDGERATTSSYNSPVSGAYGPDLFIWLNDSQHTVDVAALQQDSGGSFRYGRTNNVVLDRNSTSIVNVALSPVVGAAGSVAVSLSPPSGLTFDNITWQAYAVVDGLPLTSGVLNVNAGNLPLAPVPGATHIVTVGASLMDGADYVGSYNGLWPGVTDGSALNISVPTPPSIVTPADGASDVSLSPAIEVAPSPGAQRTIVTLYGWDPYGGVNQNWLVLANANASSFDLPVAPSIGAEMFPATDYDVSALSVLAGPPLTSANLLLWTGCFYNPGGDVSLALDGEKQLISGPASTFATGAD